MSESSETDFSFSFLHALSCLVIARLAPPGGSTEGPASAASLAELLRLDFARLRNLFFYGHRSTFYSFFKGSISMKNSGERTAGNALPSTSAASHAMMSHFLRGTSRYA